MPLGASGSQVNTLPNYHAGEYQATEVPTKIIVPNLQYPLHDSIGPVLFDDGQNFLHPDVNYGAYARPLAVPSCGPLMNNLFDMAIPNPNLYIAFDIPGIMAFDVAGNMASDILGNTAYDNVNTTSFPALDMGAAFSHPGDNQFPASASFQDQAVGHTQSIVGGADQPSGEAPLTCPHGCPGTFSRVGEYRRHTRKHGNHAYACNQHGCRMTFYRKDKLTSHLWQKHRLGQAPGASARARRG
jgi:hypothetical protein